VEVDEEEVERQMRREERRKVCTKYAQLRSGQRKDESYPQSPKTT
jgi:hypothetical protein